MKKNLLFLLILLLNNSIYGQDSIVKYEPFGFDDYSAKWMHLVIDSTIIGDTIFVPNVGNIIYNGWSEINNIEKWGTSIFQNGDDIFYTAAIFNQGFDGGIVESIDINTGALNWKSVYNHRNLSKSELPMNIFINNSGNIEVIGNRQFKETHIFAKHNTLSIRKYARKTGTLIDYSYGDETDTLTKITVSPISIFGKVYLHKFNENYQYIQQKSFYPQYSSTILDNNGKIVEERVLGVEHKSLTPSLKSLSKLSEDNYIGFRLYDDGHFDKDSFEVYIDILPKDFTSVNSMDISEKLNASDEFSLSYANKDLFIIHELEIDEIYYGSDSTIKYLYRHRFKVFDLKGKLLESISLVNKEGNVLDIYSPQIIKLKGEKGVLIVATGSNFFDDNSYSLNIYKSDGNNNLDTVKVIKIKPGHRLELISMTQLDNEDILFVVNDINDKFDNEYGGLKGKIIMCLYAKDLGLKTGIEKLIKKGSSNILLYPNPTNKMLQIEFEVELSGKLEVFDEFGIRRKKKNILNQKTIVIDISNLQNGIYSVKFEDKENTIYTRKFIKQ